MRVRRNERYLALIRRLPCLSCDTDPAGEAAHVRMSGPEKEITGMGLKPADRFALPLCRHCHTQGPNAQHTIGEVDFWTSLNLDPLAICRRLYAVRPNLSAMRDIIFAERENRS